MIHEKLSYRWKIKKGLIQQYLNKHLEMDSLKYGFFLEFRYSLTFCNSNQMTHRKHYWNYFLGIILYLYQMRRFFDLPLEVACWEILWVNILRIDVSGVWLAVPEWRHCCVRQIENNQQVSASLNLCFRNMMFSVNNI